LGEVVAVMLKLGTIAFGGPAVHVAMLREETVRRRQWVTDDEFLDLFGAVTILPGPSSTQLAIALSRRRAGWPGLALGGVCFIAPAMAIVLTLAWSYARYGTSPTGGAIVSGVEPVVIALVAVALWELAHTAIRRRWYAAIGALALAAYFLGVDVLLILVGAAAVAAVGGRTRRRLPALLPLASTSLAAGAGGRPRLVHIAGEFAKLGVIVFGSGYVLLAYLRRDLVNGLHWLSLHQVLDAVAAGQVTPGPVFTTATFVGYLLHGVAGALIATVAIFLPSFLMVVLLEPLLPRILAWPSAAGALEGVTVAALGLMAGVTVDLGRAAIHDGFTAAVAVIALVVAIRWRPNPLWMVAAGAGVGVIHAFGPW
jgi:chromate transporter